MIKTTGNKIQRALIAYGLSDKPTLMGYEGSLIEHEVEGVGADMDYMMDWPEEYGLWIWEGNVEYHKDFEGEIDVQYHGSYRAIQQDDLKDWDTFLPLR